MKKFTKISLIFVVVLAGLGIIFTGVATAMGAGWGTIHAKALAGELDFGNWHLDNGVYYSTMVNHGNQTGNETSSETYAAEDIKNIEFSMDVADIKIVDSEVSNSITVKMTKGFEKYYSCEEQNGTLKITYDTLNHQYADGPDIELGLPDTMKLKSIEVGLGVGDVTFQIAEINCEDINVDTGVGDVKGDSLTLNGTLEVSTGTGDTDFNLTTDKEIDIESGMGDIKLSGDLLCDVSLMTGCGAIELHLNSEETNYNFSMSSGLGDLIVNEAKYSEFSTQKEINHAGAAYDIEIQTGLGDIEVRTN